MDNIEKIIKLAEHPELFSEEEMTELLSDEENLKLYLTVSEMMMSLENGNDEVTSHPVFLETKSEESIADRKKPPRVRRFMRWAAAILALFSVTAAYYSHVDSIVNNNVESADKMIDKVFVKADNTVCINENATFKDVETKVKPHTAKGRRLSQKSCLAQATSTIEETVEVAECDDFYQKTFHDPLSQHEAMAQEIRNKGEGVQAAVAEIYQTINNINQEI